MTSISRIIDSILRGGDDKFCSLCLSTVFNVNSLDSEITVEINDTSETLLISQILSTLFDENIVNYSSTFDSICDTCVQSITNSYTFRQTTHQNADLLKRVIESLTDNVNCTPLENNNNSSLYISLNTNDFTVNNYYDTKKFNTNQSVLKRFKALTSMVTSEAELYTIDNKKKPNNLKIIEMLHDPSDQLTMQCKECLKTYPTKWSLKSHYLRVHAPKTYSCNKCNAKYSTRSLLDAHITESHTNASCTKCGKVYKNRQSLRLHEVGHNLSLVCPDCGRKYKNKVTFRKHIESNVCKQECRANPANAKFTCDYCNKKYTQKMSLRVHIQFEHGNYNVHVCNVCGKKFWAQSRLKAHMVKHTRERNFTCTLCTKKFVSKEALLYHTRLHTGEKPYPCPSCEKSFLSASRRTDHIKRSHRTLTDYPKQKVHSKSEEQNKSLIREEKKNEEVTMIKEDNELSMMSLQDVDVYDFIIRN